MLRFVFCTQGMEIRTGLGWVVRDLYSAADIHPFVTFNNAEGFWDVEDVTFVIPPGTRAAVLELRYLVVESQARRLAGFSLRDVRLALAEATGASLRCDARRRFIVCAPAVQLSVWKHAGASYA